MAEVEVPADFRVALTPVYRAYLDAAEALARDDLAKARDAVRKLPTAVGSVEATSLDADGRSRWTTISDSIVMAAHETADGPDRSTTRWQFHDLSLALLQLVQTFGHALPGPVYQFYCPMAFDNKGAIWLQSAAATRNPYLGPEMLACGDKKATFHSQAPLEIPVAFRQQLTGLYEAYLQLQAALAADKRDEATAALAAMQQAVSKVDAAVLDPRAAGTWQIARKQLTDGLGDDFRSLPMADVRKRFETISATMLAVVDNFGHDRQGPLYKAFCPMAFDNQGAAWLQADKKITNPYFGAKMLRCGSIQRTYAPVTPAEEKPQ
jgi:Cu(I)/Ag(I) efflux system membrane fusion protein